MGNGIANIIAALIISGAIVGSNYIDNKEAPSKSDSPATEEEFNQWLARAVGDIRNDVVVNCGCCGEGSGAKGVKRTPTRAF